MEDNITSQRSTGRPEGMGAGATTLCVHMHRKIEGRVYDRYMHPGRFEFRHAVRLNFNYVSEMHSPSGLLGHEAISRGKVANFKSTGWISRRTRHGGEGEQAPAGRLRTTRAKSVGGTIDRKVEGGQRTSKRERTSPTKRQTRQQQARAGYSSG